MNSGRRDSSIPSLSRLLAVVSLLAASTMFSPRVEAQDVELALEPTSAAILHCDELLVDVILRNPAEPVGGYQIFLRFPAEHFEALRFEPGEIDATVFQSGPPPFGDGLEPCTEEVPDPWDDGLGEDVVAVAAAVFAEDGGNEPVTGGDAVLGRFVFRPRGAPVSPEQGSFKLNTENCTEHFDQTTRLFDAQARPIDAVLSGVFSVEVFDGGPTLENLTCEPGDVDEVMLSWDPPAEDLVQAVRVHRNGELIETLPADQSSYRDVVAVTPVRSYEVTFVLEGDVDGCGRDTCLVALEVVFVRGDATTDGDLNITDPVQILRYLFQGRTITCEDAADGNDDGRIDLTDAVFVLNHLFRGGANPLPPFPGLGVDPTEDTLGCESFGGAGEGA